MGAGSGVPFNDPVDLGLRIDWPIHFQGAVVVADRNTEPLLEIAGVVVDFERRGGFECQGGVTVIVVAILVDVGVADAAGEGLADGERGKRDGGLA